MALLVRSSGAAAACRRRVVLVAAPRMPRISPTTAWEKELKLNGNRRLGILANGLLDHSLSKRMETGGWGNMPMVSAITA